MKCSHNDGIAVNIGGIPVDPCEYELIERHTNVTVEVLRCTKCGHVEVQWLRQENTDGEE